MSFEIHPATRQGVKPLVGFYGKSGSGKTMSALLFARGLAGPKGRVVLIDSESGRGSIFVDLIPGGYDVINLEPPFSPQRYEEAIVTAEANADCVAVDSMSHEWSGEGGVLDWAEAELQRMGGGDNNKMRSWIKPKIAHKMMIQRLLRTKCALVCCLRAEEKTHMIKDGDKNKVITDEFSSPLFDPRFIFEMLLNFETVARNRVGGYVIPRKITHPSIADMLPKENQQITIEHGAALARWCSSPSGPGMAAPVDDRKALVSELWALAKSVRGSERSWLGFETWAVGKEIIADTENVLEMTPERLKEVINQTKGKI